MSYYIICENIIADEQYIVDECNSRKMARMICDELEKNNCNSHFKYKIKSKYFEVQR